jgi:hypothetical protein
MRNLLGVVMLVAFVLSVSGCGQSAGTTAKSKDSSKGKTEQQFKAAENDPEGSAVAKKPLPKTDDPAAAVAVFLEALRTGDDETATQMLSTIAREKTVALTGNIKPPATDTAKYTVGKVTYVGDDGAQVTSTWTDLDEEGQAVTDTAIWVLRKEETGWRVAGVAAEVFPGEPPVLQNFEDPEDMFRKQEMVRKEIQRRMALEQTEKAPEVGEKKENSIKR